MHYKDNKLRKHFINRKIPYKYVTITIVDILGILPRSTISK